MIKEIIADWEKYKQKIRDSLVEADDKDELSYLDIVKILVENISLLESVTEVSSGDYQGVNLYVFTGDSYSRDFYYMTVNYGSCSGCDTLARLQSDKYGDERIDGYMTLVLHMVQNIKQLEYETF